MTKRKNNSMPMLTHLLRYTTALGILLLLPQTLQAREDGKRQMFNPIHTALVSQAIAPDARAGGMGDVGAATDPDVVSQYWNAAKYPFTISRAGVALNYTPWLRQLVNDMDLAYLAGYYRIGDYSAISGSLNYFSLGEVYTSMAEDAYTIHPYEMSVDVAYSIMLSENFSMAAGLRYLFSDMSYSTDEEKPTAGAFAADLSMYYQNYLNMGDRECQLGLGMNISNIGSKINFSGTDDSEFIPTNLRLGASLMIPVDEYNRFTIAADANKLLVPTYPSEDQYKADPKKDDYLDYEEYVRRNYYDQSSIGGMFKSFSDAPNGWVPNTSITTSSASVPATIMSHRARVTVSTSLSVPASR